MVPPAPFWPRVDVGTAESPLQSLGITSHGGSRLFVGQGHGSDATLHFKGLKMIEVPARAVRGARNDVGNYNKFIQDTVDRSFKNFRSIN